MRDIIDKLEENHCLQQDEYLKLLSCKNQDDLDYLHLRARSIAQQHFGNKVFVRGLIEFSNYCKNDCFYCGIRASNRKVERYRLSKEDILECCEEGYRLGYRTFVLQSGEDDSYRDDMMVDIISSIRKTYPDCAITVSMGEKQKSTYQKYFDAGANRYLLRHESINPQHYESLHPSPMKIATRVHALYDLKAIGFQTGSGIMVGSPKQTLNHLIEDIEFLEKLQPEMIGIGPYLPHCDTPFKDEAKGSMELTLILISILRLMHPNALIPSTTALATIKSDGREKGILAGANVVMPNLSPVRMRKKYALYNDKACMDAEAATCSNCLPKRLETIGYELSYAIGNYKPMKEGE